MEKNEGPNESLFSHTTVSSCASTGVTTGGNNVSLASTGSYQDFAVCTCLCNLFVLCLCMSYPCIFSIINCNMIYIYILNINYVLAQGHHSKS